VVRRATGTPVDVLLRSALLEPLGLRDTHLGLPASQWHRRVPVRAQGAAALAGGAFFNRARTRRAVVPAAGVSTTARDLARFYQALLRGGELDGARVLRPDTVAVA
jgi:CubicO group peptidase (beta-lactamase class C family)